MSEEDDVQHATLPDSGRRRRALRSGRPATDFESDFAFERSQGSGAFAGTLVFGPPLQTNQPAEALPCCRIVHLLLLAVSLAFVLEMCAERLAGSDLFQRLLDEGAVSPLGQDDGLHVFPVQAAALGSVEMQLGRGVVVLQEGRRGRYISLGLAKRFYYNVHQVFTTGKQLKSILASTKLVAQSPQAVVLHGAITSADCSLCS